MSLLTPNTGDEQMDKAYVHMQNHIDRCKDFETFNQHFKYVAKTDDLPKLNLWLLKVLFVQMRQVHPFDELLNHVEASKKQELESWLENMLTKVKGA
ncbi:hypothetical protein [Sulfurimonas sp.]|uniref:hypothetical protein n=1 Tax=Sulfurimonas sp. TaxID=2022749 RepID=UPI002B4A8CCD|nr:hypothetical protein [Sulfurimonas sp.]